MCPLVEDKGKVEAKAATAEYERLQAEELHDLRVGLLHGQMPSKEKEAVMRAFRAGEIDVLVATTVIEVGVDVPNATVMIVEDADRFGLSQLHQLRGRVGRGGDRSYCFLFADPSTEDGEERLKAMAASTDGFALAEKDLEIRGSGEVFGERQSGFSDLKLGRIPRDEAIVIGRARGRRGDPRPRPRSRAPTRNSATRSKTSSATPSTSCSSREQATAGLRVIAGTRPRPPPRRARRRSGPADEGHRARGDVQRARRARRARGRGRARPLRGHRRARDRGAVARRARRRSLVERDRAALRGDPRPTSRCSADGATVDVVPRDVGRFLAGGPPPEAAFDLVFVDPPYDTPDDEITGLLAVLDGARLARARRDRQRGAAAPPSRRRPARALDGLGANLRRYAFDVLVL